MSAEHEKLTSPMSPVTADIQVEANDNDPEPLTSVFRELLGNDSSNMDYELAGRIIVNFAQKSDPTLDLSRLLRWEIAEDIYEAAERLSAELGQSITLTKTENSVSGGRIIHTADGAIILVPASTLRNLVDGPDGMAQFALNLLHHELCHVHDEAVRKSMPGWKDSMVGLPLTNRMIDIMILLWDEYSANRRSISTTQPVLEKMQFELVVAEYPRVNAEISQSIESWREHGDMRRLFSELSSSFGHMFKLLGYALGSSAGRGVSLEQLDPVSYRFLRGTWLASLLEDESVEQLNTLYESFGNWSGIEVFDDFAETCRLAYWDAGIQIFASQEGLTANI
nr:hypothetical protein [uncultured Duganella sp.]